MASQFFKILLNLGLQCGNRNYFKGIRFLTLAIPVIILFLSHKEYTGEFEYEAEFAKKNNKIERGFFKRSITLSLLVMLVQNEYHTHSKLQHFSYKQKVALLIRNQDAKA